MLIATCSRGLEDVLGAEILALGGRNIGVGRGMVSFAGDIPMMMRACLGLRCAIRVLIHSAAGAVTGRDDLYGLARGVAWEDFLPRGGTVGVTVAGQSRVVNNTHFAAQVVKDAVVDRIRDRRGERPSVDVKRPHLPIHLHLRDDLASIALDAAGPPLSKRGYRRHGGPAPLNEALAAGLLLIAGYDGEQALLDPMGGSGTFAVEAAMIATRTPPGRFRRFAFERWLGHDRSLLDDIRRDLEDERRKAPGPIIAQDADAGAVRAARRNLKDAGMEEWVVVEQGEATTLQSPGDGGLIVINPPYGKRLGEASALVGLYGALGDRLKTAAAGCTAWILAGDRELAKRVGLKAARRIPVFNGPIECRWMRYDLYEGTHKMTE